MKKLVVIFVIAFLTGCANSVDPSEEVVSPGFDPERIEKSLGKDLSESAEPEMNSEKNSEQTLNAENSLENLIEKKSTEKKVGENFTNKIKENSAANLDSAKENEKVLVEVFTDFQCPFCSRFAQSTSKLHERDDIEMKLFQFPLDFHPNARPAAAASICAENQGKTWEMHDLLFANQENLTVANFKKFAADLNLNSAKFEECLSAASTAQKIDADFAAGVARGVTGTPSTFIGGKMMVGAQPLENIEKEIRAAAAK